MADFEDDTQDESEDEEVMTSAEALQKLEEVSHCWDQQIRMLLLLCENEIRNMMRSQTPVQVIVKESVCLLMQIPVLNPNPKPSQKA